MVNEFLIYKLERERVNVNSQKEYFDFQKNLPESSVLQLPSFASRFYAKRNCHFFRLLKNEVVVGVCLVNIYIVNAEIQFGPMVVSGSDMGIFVEKICSFFRKRFFGQLKVCFPINLQKEIYESTIAHISKNFVLAREIIGNWSSLVINLNEDIERIQTRYSKNLRRNIKKATQHGLSVRQIIHEKDILGFGNIFDELYKFRKVKSNWNDSPATFLSWYRSIELFNKIIWLGVYNAKDELIGGILLIVQKDTLFFQLGASNPKQRNMPILHLCFHQAILFGKENYFSFFDFGGYDTDAKEINQTYNINLFKKQFGGKLVTSFPNIIIELNKPIKIIIDFLLNFRKRKSS